MLRSIRPSPILVSLLGTVGCGGQVQDPVETWTDNPGLGGAAGSVEVPIAGATAAAGGSFTRSDSATGGVAVGGAASGGSRGIGGNFAIGGTATRGCSTTSRGWSLCVANSGGSTNKGAIASKGGDSCAAPQTSTYVVGSNYAGYAFAFISLGPTHGDVLECALTGTDALCLTGEMASIENSPEGLSVVGAVGLNLAQAAEPNSPAKPLSGTVRSVTVAFTNMSGSELRLQINQGSKYYCYQVSPAYVGYTTGSITLDADQFLTECWDDEGESWDGTGATGIQLIAPSASIMINTPTDFSACLNSVAINT